MTYLFWTRLWCQSALKCLFESCRSSTTIQKYQIDQEYSHRIQWKILLFSTRDILSPHQLHKPEQSKMGGRHKSSIRESWLQVTNLGFLEKVKLCWARIPCVGELRSRFEHQENEANPEKSATQKSKKCSSSIALHQTDGQHPTLHSQRRSLMSNRLLGESVHSTDRWTLARTRPTLSGVYCGSLCTSSAELWCRLPIRASDWHPRL